MTKRLLVCALGWVLALPCGGRAADPAILCPREGFRAGGGAAWVVVASKVPAKVFVDGKDVTGRGRFSDGRLHVRVEGLRAGGSKIVVDARGRRAQTTVYGWATSPDTFHGREPAGCADCHEAADCAGCHRWPAKHAHLRRGCGSCHPGNRGRAAAVPALCAPCHPKHANGRHPALRHPVSGGQDPLRPGRTFGCLSCHDAHSPADLGGLGPEKKREWCKGCHRK